MDLECFDLNWRDGYLEALVPDGDGGKRVERVPRPFDPYCYIEEDALVMDPLRVCDCRIGDGAPDGYLKIEADSPRNIRDFRERFAFQTYEADVPYNRRVMVDEDVSIARPDDEDVLYFDIEVDDGDGFPGPEEASSQVLAVSAIGGDGREMYFDDADEEALITAFLEAADDYAILAGWNSLDFDFRYLENRAATEFGMSVNWNRWLRLDVMPLYDMLAVPTKTVSTKLDDTGERELGVGKTDVSAGGGAVRELREEDPARLEEYAMRDTDLVRRIDEKYGLVDLLLVICDLCGFPPGDACYLTKHGQVRFAIGQVVDSKLLEVAHRKGIPQANKRTYEKGDDFPGGYVLEPEPGMYEDVVTPDYSSMYPNIVRAWNFGRETWVPDENLEKNDDTWRITSGEWRGCRAIKGETGGFVHPDDGARSVPAEAADELISLRDGASAIVDKGVKAVNNTLYGVFASDHQRYFGPHSENITLIGQELTGTVERIAESGHELIGDVVYGDSIPGYEPVVWRDEAGIHVDHIEKLHGNLPDGAEAWGADGWSPIRRVIRKPNRKQMLRVRTNAGIVHVTEDHSLITAGGDEVKPRDVAVGDELLHREVDTVEQDVMATADHGRPRDTESWLLGVFAGDGSAGIYNGKSQWKVSKNDIDLLERVGEALREVHDMGYKVRDSYTDDSTFVTPAGNGLKDLAAEYREMCYTETGEKRVPDSILNGGEAAARAFIIGYAEADGEQSGEFEDVLKRASTKSHVLAQGIRLLVSRAGLGFGVEARDNHGNEYLRFWTRNWARTPQDEVLSIEQLNYDGDHVYDIDTRDGMFQAGVGDIVVHNTDSVMVAMDIGDASPIEMAYEIASDAEAEMQEWARGRGAIAEYLELDVDDVYARFYIGDRKKRYFGNRVYDGEPCDDFKVRGFEVRQGDWPAPVRRFQEDLMHALLDDEPTAPIIEDARDMLFSGRWDHELEESTKLGKPVDEYQHPLPHTRAAEGIRGAYGDGAVQVGDKVDYVKYGPGKTDVTWVYDGQFGVDFRQNEAWCDECGEVVVEAGHEHETEDHPHFRDSHYGYIWRQKFKSVMGSIGVSEYEQKGLGDFA